MRAVTAYITETDGVLHASRDDALRHARKRYDAHLTKLAHGCVHTDARYSRVIEWLDANRHELAELVPLAADLASLKDDR